MVEEHLRFEALLADLLAAFTSASRADVDELIDEWLGRVAAYLAVDEAAIYDLEEGTDTFRRTFGWCGDGRLRLPVEVKQVTFLRGERGEGGTFTPFNARSIGVPLEIDAKVSRLVLRVRTGDGVWPRPVVRRLPLIARALSAAVAKRRTEHMVADLAARLVYARARNDPHRIGAVAWYESRGLGAAAASVTGGTTRPSPGKCCGSRRRR